MITSLYFLSKQTFLQTKGLQAHYMLTYHMGEKGVIKGALFAK